MLYSKTCCIIKQTEQLRPSLLLDSNYNIRESYQIRAICGVWFDVITTPTAAPGYQLLIPIQFHQVKSIVRLRYRLLFFSGQLWRLLWTNFPISKNNTCPIINPDDGNLVIWMLLDKFNSGILLEINIGKYCWNIYIIYIKSMLKCFVSKCPIPFRYKRVNQSHRTWVSLPRNYVYIVLLSVKR